MVSFFPENLCRARLPEYLTATHRLPYAPGLPSPRLPPGFLVHSFSRAATELLYFFFPRFPPTLPWPRELFLASPSLCAPLLPDLRGPSPADVCTTPPLSLYI